MCMHNGKTLFDIPNVPADHVLLLFNILFTFKFKFVYDVVSGGKGIMLLKIDPSKTQTIINLMDNTLKSLSRSLPVPSSTSTTRSF